MNIALVSPSENTYSETFIQAHKDLEGRVYFYYSGFVPTKLEGGIIWNSRKIRILDVVQGYFNLNKFTLTEKAVISSFKRNRIDLVLAEFGQTGKAILPICKESKIPLIVHFHGFDASCYSVATSDNYRLVFEYATYVICVSKKMHGDLLKIGCPKEKLIYNACGPREDFFGVQPKFSKSQFLSVGRFVNKKAPYYLILSFRKVLEKFPDAQLIMAGDGALWESCKNLIRFFGLYNNIHLVGVVNSEQIREYMRDSLAFVQHSITAENGDAEGTPVVVMEAGAAGLPVISTFHAGIPDVILNEETGLLVDEHDTDGMARNMMRLLETPDLAKKLGAASRERIKEEYSMARHISSLNDLIAKAVKQQI